MKPAEPEIAELAFRSFARATGLFRSRMDPYFARFGISGAQWGVLRTLQRAEAQGLTGLHLSELGQQLWVRPPTVTSLVNRLERIGLVTKEATTVDHRAKQVSLTPEGRCLLARVLRHHPAQMRAVMAGLSEGELGTLHRLMERLAARLETIDARDGLPPEPAPEFVERSTP